MSNIRSERLDKLRFDDATMRKVHALRSVDYDPPTWEMLGKRFGFTATGIQSGYSRWMKKLSATTATRPM